VAFVAVVSAFVANFAILPLNCTAGNRGEAAELTFFVGGNFGGSRRISTNAAGCSASATAVQFESAAALLASVLGG
jgi:hypothetical protein